MFEFLFDTINVMKYKMLRVTLRVSLQNLTNNHLTVFVLLLDGKKGDAGTPGAEGRDGQKGSLGWRGQRGLPGTKGKKGDSVYSTDSHKVPFFYISQIHLFLINFSHSSSLLAA